MSIKLRFQTFFVSVMVFAFLFGQSYHVTEGFKQSLKLYFNTTTEGGFLEIETNYPNLDDYSALLPKVQLACVLGWWISFSDTNYQGTWHELGSVFRNQTKCEPFNARNTKSIRHHGMSETTRDGFSLYEGDFYRGTEILVEESAYTGIKTPINSIVGTGNSQWNFFEGLQLEGKSVCIQVPWPEYNFYYDFDVKRNLNLTNIGSVFKGCNVSEIKEYKRQHNM